MPISDQVLMIDAKGAPKRRLLVPRPRKKYRLGAAMSYTGFSVVFRTNSLGSRQDEDVYCFTLDHGCFAFFVDRAASRKKLKGQRNLALSSLMASVGYSGAPRRVQIRDSHGQGCLRDCPTDIFGN
jgi:hypothetical protein